jgi:dephospho-CoA kinase
MGDDIYAVGLTGGVASGKSTVAGLFAALGVDVVDADVAARDVVAPGSAGLSAVADAFGPEVLDADGGLDRAAMRRRVFADQGARSLLQSILHPRIRSLLQESARQAAGPYALVVIPLLAEGGGRAAYPWLDRILVVDVPPELQRTRLLARDAIDAALAEGMLAAQSDRSQRLAIADDVLVNDDAVGRLAPQVAALDAQYRRLAKACRS